MKRDLVTLDSLSADEFMGLLRLAAQLKAGEHPPYLAGKTLAMLFAKASTRTRVSFEVGAFQLGGHAINLAARDSQIGRGEPISDTAQVLSRYVDGIMVRTYDQADVCALAENASVPVINGLTDLTHPCQILADLMTCAEEFGIDALSALTVTWIGDGNNMANSWINAARVLKFRLNLACPSGYDPDAALMKTAQDEGVSLHLTRDLHEAAKDADVITTDVWASMGQEDEAKARQIAFELIQVTEDVMSHAKPGAIFLHCLPAHRGEEVTANVIDGPQSRIFDEAENRLHVQKAIMAWCMGGVSLSPSQSL
jgi:ornithine carbamoyltransferase